MNLGNFNRKRLKPDVMEDDEIPTLNERRYVRTIIIQVVVQVVAFLIEITSLRRLTIK